MPEHFHVLLRPSESNCAQEIIHHRDTETQSYYFPVKFFSEPLSLGGSQHHPLDPVAQNRDVEVEEQSGVDLGEPQVREQLRFVDRQEALHGLQFHNHSPSHHHIQPGAAIEPHAFVDHRQRNLALKG